ncbi:MAG: DUF1156 domain-containing protein [Caldilineaceae bacterium]|nr:DUF1156 domain-containing protein [Caldilineaceae bacterium]
MKMTNSRPDAVMNPAERPLAGAPCFIETQFPVAKISMESYKERKAGNRQTLTGLGKWWGRKPLVLVRAAILGLLLPSTDDPIKDCEIFLKLMTMDSDGLRRRKSKSIPGARLLAEVQTLSRNIQRQFLDESGTAIRRLNRDERGQLQDLVFSRMSYVEKLQYSDRPEQIDGPSQQAWREINAHLGTSALSLPELVEQLGIMRFGHRPRVGDAFCGGGSVPFEAARIGCDAYGSDLNPVAALLTWAALNIVGGGEEVIQAVQEAQQEVYEAVDRQIIEWGIEHNELGWRADAYLYCVEVTDPETGWPVPLAPSWVIGEGSKTVAKLIPDENNKCYEIEIIENASLVEMKLAKESGTVKDFRLVSPNGNTSIPIEVLRQNIRTWEKEDIASQPQDIFHERLYCIRWVESYIDENGRLQSQRHYRAPTDNDLQREERVLELLQERFKDWQERGYIPNSRIEPGQDINRPTNARGWTHWHHLFNARQLLINGLSMHFYDQLNLDRYSSVGVLLGIGRQVDWNSRLSRWNSNAANEKGEQTFYKPSLGTPSMNYSCRPQTALRTAFLLNLPTVKRFTALSTDVELLDTRTVSQCSDVWVTDPPYADAVYYHELSEFFLAWYQTSISELFPTWYADSKRAMAIKGTDESFRSDHI